MPQFVSDTFNKQEYVDAVSVKHWRQNNGAVLPLAILGGNDDE